MKRLKLVWTDVRREYFHVLVDGVDVAEILRPDYDDTMALHCVHETGESTFEPTAFDPALLDQDAVTDVILLVCGCGVPGCSAVWAEMDRRGDRIRLRPVPGEPNNITPCGELEFDREQYAGEVRRHLSSRILREPEDRNPV